MAGGLTESERAEGAEVDAESPPPPLDSVEAVRARLPDPAAVAHNHSPARRPLTPEAWGPGGSGPRALPGSPRAAGASGGQNHQPAPVAQNDKRRVAVEPQRPPTAAGAARLAAHQRRRPPLGQLPPPAIPCHPHTLDTPPTRTRPPTAEPARSPEALGRCGLGPSAAATPQPARV